MNDTQIMETIRGCFEEMIVGINGRLDQMQTELREGLHEELREHERRFDRIDERLDGMDERFDGIDRRLDGIDERLDGIDERLDEMDERFDRMDAEIAGVNDKVSNLAFYVENVTDKSIRILAENHLDLTNKLAAGIEAAENNRVYAVQVGYLIEDVDRMRKELELVKMNRAM